MDHPALSSPRILVVDDECAVALALKFHLARHGFAASAAFDGEQAVAAASDGGFDLVITDYMMPRMDGGRLVDRLRARSRDLPIIMLTGAAGDAEAAVLAHAADVLVLDKPADFSVVRRHAEALLARAASPEAPAVMAGADA